MARIVDFTRDRYRGFARGVQDERRQINTELRQIKNQYLSPRTTIPLALSAGSGALEMGKGLMQRAAKSKALAGMSETARAARDSAEQAFARAQANQAALDTSMTHLQGGSLIGGTGLDTPQFGSELGTATRQKIPERHIYLGQSSMPGQKVGFEPGRVDMFGHGRPDGLGVGTLAEPAAGLNPASMIARQRGDQQTLVAQAEANLENTRRRVADLEGINKHGHLYLQQQSALADTPERQRELLNLAAMTQGPQYQGRSMAQLAAGQTAPDVNQITNQRALMSSMFPQTADERAAAALKSRAAVAGVRKAEAQAAGEELGNVPKQLEATLSNLKQIMASDPKYQKLLTGVDELIEKVKTSKSQRETAEKELKRKVRRDDAQIDMDKRNFSRAESEFDRKMRLEYAKLDEQKKARIQKARGAGGKGKGDRTATRATISFSDPKISSAAFFNMGAAKQYINQYQSSYSDMSPTERIKWAQGVVSGLGLTSELRGLSPDDGALYNAAVEGVATKAMKSYISHAEGSKKAFEGIDTNNKPVRVAGNVINQARRLAQNLAGKVRRLSAGGKKPKELAAKDRENLDKFGNIRNRIDAEFSNISDGSYESLKELIMIMLEPESLKAIELSPNDDGGKELLRRLGIRSSAEDLN